MRSAVSVSAMMMPFGDTVSVTLRNFLAPALAYEWQAQECMCTLKGNQAGADRVLLEKKFP